MSVRIYDIPHASSRAVIWSARSVAPFVGGIYTFPTAWQSLSPAVMLRKGVYVIRQLMFSANIDEGDWQSNWTSVPQIWFGSAATSLSSQFREALPLTKYTEGTEFIEAIHVLQEPCELKFRMTGVLNQSPSLVGVQNITATTNLVAYEISDDKWINEFLKGWTP
jgi:hypothetical protein